MTIERHLTERVNNGVQQIMTRRRKSFTVPCCMMVVAAALQQILLTGTVRAQSNSFVQTTVPCGGNTTMERNSSGYVTIEAMNLDMQVELEQIRNGRPSLEPYIFVLCPDVVFDLSIEPLRPLLSGSVFTCGLMGNISLGCEFNGGTDQIILDDIGKNITNYNLLSVSFIGITHTGFTSSVFSGTATSATTIDITQSLFRDFQSTFMVRQWNEDGTDPFKVQIAESTISNAMGNSGNDQGTLFANLGGELSIQDVIIDSCSLMSIVTTGSSNTTEGSTFLRSVTVKESDVLVCTNLAS